MKNKQKDRSISHKIIHMKYLGFVVVGALFLSFGAFVYMVLTDGTFFDKWSCTGIDAYLKGDIPPGVPTHDELSTSEHEKIHQYHNECLENDMYSDLTKH